VKDEQARAREAGRSARGAHVSGTARGGTSHGVLSTLISLLISVENKDAECRSVAGVVGWRGVHRCGVAEDAGAGSKPIFWLLVGTACERGIV
jgi:hypothetical protein